MEKFRLQIMSPEDAPKAAFVQIPTPKIHEMFNTYARVFVKGLVDGVEYSGTFLPMGGYHVMGIPKELREKLGKGQGDFVDLTVELDHEERVVNLPEDLKELLAKYPEEKKHFDSLAYSHKKEYVNWLISAKREVTRQSRLKKLMEMLKADMGRG